MEHWWYHMDNGKTKVLGEKPVQLPLCTPQISQGLAWDRKGATVVTGRSHCTANKK
jgi:hypothetical protein